MSDEALQFVGVGVGVFLFVLVGVVVTLLFMTGFNRLRTLDTVQRTALDFVSDMAKDEVLRFQRHISEAQSSYDSRGGSPWL